MSENLKLSLEGCIQETTDGIRIVLNVKPKSRLDSLKHEFGEFVFFTKEPPVKGKANATVIKFLCRAFEVSTSIVKIVHVIKIDRRSWKLKEFQRILLFKN